MSGITSFLDIYPQASPEKMYLIIQQMTKLPQKFRPVTPYDNIHKLAEVFPVPHPKAMCMGLVSCWKQPLKIVLGASKLPTTLRNSQLWTNLPDLTQHMMYLDTVTYLPDGILVKVDRAAMGVSLESRIPFLDHRLVELAWRIPLSMKIRHGQGKWLLRQILYKYVPQALIEHLKSGFGISIDRCWLEQND
ncbi:MAG TPA: asparagine synthase C-terminal domain-containing protein [Nostocaceae cyanobacterium]|nr:asparagine synthase C-terminal domain-containing protein [Nostocaceae cyanobacterium]